MVCFDVAYKIKKDGKFWFVECKAYPVFTQGRTKKEAIDNLREAFMLYAEDSDVQSRFPELKQLFYSEKAVEAPPASFAVTVVQPASFFETIHDPLTDPFRKRTGENPV